MGAWGHEFYANDDAADWLAEFADAPSWTTVADALKLNGDYIEADAASHAVAAAELVAAGLGKPHDDFTPKTSEWIAANSEGAGPLKGSALAAVTTVLNGSELQELWDEAEDTSWRDEVSNLQSRLS